MYSDFEGLSEEMAQAAVAKYFGLANPSGISITSMEAKDGSKVGDGMTSVLKELDINFTLPEELAKNAPNGGGGIKAGNMNVMGKFAPKGSRVSQWWGKMNLFEREIEFYSRVAPEIEKRLEAVSKTEHPLSYVKTFCTNLDPAYIIMENLKTQGYKLCHDDDKALTNALTLDQLRLTLRELARFHAASYDFVQTYPGGCEKFDKDFPWVGEGGKLGQFMTKDQEVCKENHQLYTGLLGKVAEGLRQSDSYDQTLVDRLANFIPEASTKCGLSRHPGEHPFTMVVHGDFWSNNILFRTDPDTGELTDVKIIDFQECMRSRPTTDLCCLFLTSMLPKLRRDHWKDLLEFYHKELVRNLSQFGYSETVYTMEQLLKDYRSSYGHGFYWAVINAHATLNDEGQDLASLLSGEQKTIAKEDSVKENVNSAGTNCGGRGRIESLVKEAAEVGMF